jgi:transposase
LFPDHLDTYSAENNPVRGVDVFVEQLDFNQLGFNRAEPAITGRPSYPPLNSPEDIHLGLPQPYPRRLERETQRNLELIWLTGRLMPNFKTIARFRKEKGPALRKVGSQCVLLCRQLNLFSEAMVAIDGSKFKAVNNRDRSFTANKSDRRREQIEASSGRCLSGA